MSRINKLKTDSLKPHPTFTRVYGPLPPTQLRNVSQVLASRGLERPIDVLPDRTVFSGHDEAQAGLSLGWEEIDVRVWDDVEGLNDPSVILRLEKDGSRRQHIKPLERLRLAKTVWEEAYKTPYAGWDASRRARFKESVGQTVGGSKRNLERYLRVLGTPEEVQDALAAGRLKLKSADAIAGLGSEVQREIAARIRAGEDPEAVAVEHLPPSTGRHKSRGAAFAELLRLFQRNLTDHGDGAEHIKRIDPTEFEILSRMGAFIAQILDQAECRESVLTTILRQPRAGATET